VNLPNGTYDLTLHFAEVSGAITGDGQLVFDVFVEGDFLLEHLDIYAAVAGQWASPKLVAGARDYATALTQRIEPVSASERVITLHLLTARGRSTRTRSPSPSARRSAAW